MGWGPSCNFELQGVKKIISFNVSYKFVIINVCLGLTIFYIEIIQFINADFNPLIYFFNKQFYYFMFILIYLESVD